MPIVKHILILASIIKHRLVFGEGGGEFYHEGEGGMRRDKT